jgi:hypothetical protein
MVIKKIFDPNKKKNEIFEFEICMKKKITIFAAAAAAAAAAICCF